MGFGLIKETLQLLNEKVSHPYYIMFDWAKPKCACSQFQPIESYGSKCTWVHSGMGLGPINF